jgi:hypothetical protein
VSGLRTPVARLADAVERLAACVGTCRSARPFLNRVISSALAQIDPARLCPIDLTSDPHAWLRPYYIALKNDSAFWMLAEPLRFEALCCAVEREHPSRAASMREWSPAAQQGILGWLETVTKEKPAVQKVELWRVTKDSRELRCVVRYMPHGVICG